MEFTAPFIKCGNAFDRENTDNSYAPIFRKKFAVSDFNTATLKICALGFGYCYINGMPITEDLFSTPVSDYGKLVWYNEYDVSELLKSGENIIAVILGNGFFNENFPSAWGIDKAYWRDSPKVALSLVADGEILLESDDSFLCTDESFITYNELRSGETFDARKYDENWNTCAFDDSHLKNAVIDCRMTGVERRLCDCEPIREIEEYDFVSVRENKDGYLLDFGVNISGYLKCNISEPYGTEIVLRHAEEADKNGELRLNRCDRFYPTVDFQTDRFISGGKPMLISPKFTYHGFRFVSVSGLSAPPKPGDFRAVFVHSDVKRISEFNCSNSLLNALFDAGIRSSFSNMFYCLTDCPTREKLAWTNDTAASLEQLYFDFDIRRFMSRWSADLLLSMKESGEIPATIPSDGWCYGYGPVADSILFELPYVEYLYTGDSKKLSDFLPFMKKYYSFFRKEEYDKKIWLCDWTGHGDLLFTDHNFIKLFFTVKFCRIMLLAERLSGGVQSQCYRQDQSEALAELREKYIVPDGTCVLDNQCAVSMMIYLETFDNAPLVKQLKRRVEQDGFRFRVGMLGMQYICGALAENGMADYVYKMMTAKGEHTFEWWIRCGNGTLWESFYEGHTDSRNHHMFSCVLTYFFKYLLGVKPSQDYPAFKRIDLSPCFLKELSYCKGSLTLPDGCLDVAWKRENGVTQYCVNVPAGITAFFHGKKCNTGENVFFI